MEHLSQSVYECTLAVEAHMICDLLARAGISARVDGEFLSGAGGELPLGSTIRVRVDPSRAAEAREVINDWEKVQPAPEPDAKPAKRSSWRSPLWFFAGVVVGGGLMVFGLRTPYTSEGAHLDGDGIVDEVYHYRGQVLDMIEYDRNADRKIDARWFYDLNGVATHRESDDDFDGRFEWHGNAVRGFPVREEMDVDGNGKPERAWVSKHGVLRAIEIYDSTQTRVVARELFDSGRHTHSEYDQDGDGVFERRVDYDELGEAIAASPP
jgi:hypothetical protein